MRMATKSIHMDLDWVVRRDEKAGSADPELVEVRHVRHGGGLEAELSHLDWTGAWTRERVGRRRGGEVAWSWRPQWPPSTTIATPLGGRPPFLCTVQMAAFLSLSLSRILC
jgi:hypothetical protein